MPSFGSCSMLVKDSLLSLLTREPWGRLSCTPFSEDCSRHLRLISAARRSATCLSRIAKAQPGQGIVAPYGPFSFESIEYTRIIRCTVYTPYTVFSKNTCTMGSRSTASSEYTRIIRCTVYTPYNVQCNYGARHTALCLEPFDHVENSGTPVMHPPISTLMPPPNLSCAVCTKLKWIQRLSCWTGNPRVPVQQKSWVQCSKRVAWTDKTPCAEWTSATIILSAAMPDTGLPCMLVFTPLRPALVTLAEPPHLPITPTGQRPCVNAIISGGVEFCTDVWQHILHKSTPCTGLRPALPCTLWAACRVIHPLKRAGIPLAVLCACPPYLSFAVATYAS